ncbi:cytochrome P450 [Xylariales sp. AK1849]|nr:cytochrome P450 [Xylariales sp. AK1849]
MAPSAFSPSPSFEQRYREVFTMDFRTFGSRVQIPSVVLVMVPSWLSELFAMVLFYFLTKLVVLVYIAPSVPSWYRLRHIPGPFLPSLSKYWQMKTRMQGKWHLELKKVGDQYGELFRIGPNQIMTTDVAVIRKMAELKSPYTRGSFYQTFRFIPTQDSSVTPLNNEEDACRYTKLEPGYIRHLHVEDCIKRQCARLANLIEQNYVSTRTEYRPIYLTAVSYYFSMDVLGDLSYGRPFGYLDEGKDVHNFIKWPNSFFPATIVASNLHWLIKILFKPLFNHIYASMHDKEGLGKYLALAVDVTERRFDQLGEQGKDVLASHIEHGVTKEEATDKLMLQMIAGTDAIATGIRTTLSHLVAAPLVYNKLRAEIDNAISAGRISSPIRDDESRNLPYLQAVIKEGLRIFPVMTATVFKRVPKGGDILAGYHVPEGTEVGHDVLGTMRARKYWGPDPDVFRPERWLDADGERHDMMSEALETLWGAGKYKCLGRTIAQMQLNKVYVELLRRFDFSIVTPRNPVQIMDSGFLVSDLQMRVTRIPRLESVC